MATLLATATDGLATDASVQELRLATELSVARLEARIYRALRLQGMGLLGAIVAATGIILAAMRLWM